jgi:hypothetical protein
MRKGRTDVADDRGYLLDNQQAEAGTRFGALAALFNSSTFRHLDGLGLAAGWRCWEVGAGRRAAGRGGRPGDAAAGLSGRIRSGPTGPACAVLERATVAQIRDRLIDAGLATDQEIDEHLANVDASALDLATSPMVSAWGRKPA